MTKTFATTNSILLDAYSNQQIAGFNDLYVGVDGNLVVAGLTLENNDQLNAVLYSCQNISRSVLGEMVLQVNRGLPNFQTIWNGNPDIAQWEIALRTALLSVDGVIEISEIDVVITGDVLNYAATIITNFGQGIVDGVTNLGGES